MTTRIPRPLLLLATLAGLAACGDAPTEPGALLVARETQAALQVSEALPTLPRLMATARGAASLGAAVDAAPAEALERGFALWLDAQASTGEEAEALAGDAYAAAAPALAELLGPAEVERAIEDVRRWIALARPLVGVDERLGLQAPLEEGEALVLLAESRAAAGEATAAVHALLEAADRLRETTPWAVSAALIGQAEGDLERRGIGTIDRNPAPSDREAVTLARVQRLLDGAREAREEGDYALAIQRAYYARQLLERLP